MRTNAGADFQAQQLGSTSPGTNGANYIGLTANATAPAAGDTTLTGELAAAGGGLSRGQATYAHTAGTSTFTLTKVFTANASDVLPVSPAKIGVFNAASGGVLAFETLVTTPPTLAAAGDQFTVTETISM